MNALENQFSPYLRNTRHSETLLINELSNQRAVNDQPLYRFGFGQSPFPVPEHIVDALRMAAHRKEYLGVQGLPELRQSAASFHSHLGSATWNPDRVIVGAGSKILLYCLMAALREADVAVVAPCWVSYEPQAELAGHRVFHLEASPDDDWRLTPGALDRFCSERASPERPLILILNYPGNPSGQSYSGDQLAALVPVLRAHNVCVLADEIYGLLHHDGEHVSLADFYPEGTIVTTGLSKWCGAGGWRLGIAHVPEQLGEGYFSRVVGVCSETYSCVSTPVQYAALAAYNLDSRISGFVQQQRSLLADIGKECATNLGQADIQVRPPQGGFYVFPNFAAHRESLAQRGIFTGAELTAQLLRDTGVALLPGSAFGMEQSSLTARLAYVDFDGAAALRDGCADSRHLNEGVERICEWLGIANLTGSNC